MKKMTVLFGILAIALAVCFSGCSAQNNIVITDGKTGEIVAAFSSKEHQAEAALLTNALNNTEEMSAEFDYSQKYLVHFIDPKDSLYDIWYYIYVSKDNHDVYVQYDMEKMKEFDDQTPGFADDKVRKSTRLNAVELSDIISAKYK